MIWAESVIQEGVASREQIEMAFLFLLETHPELPYFQNAGTHMPCHRDTETRQERLGKLPC